MASDLNRMLAIGADFELHYAYRTGISDAYLDELRQLLGERLHAADLLEAGRIYRIRIDVRATGTEYWVDDRQLFSQALAQLPATGYFGFRSVWSRQAISRFSVRALQEVQA